MLFLMKFKTMSKELYWFNEDTNDVQNFYFNNWENFDDPVDGVSSLIAGVIIKFIIYNCYNECILLLGNFSKR